MRPFSALRPPPSCHLELSFPTPSAGLNWGSQLRGRAEMWGVGAPAPTREQRSPREFRSGLRGHREGKGQ